jgi:outer membrane protein OmpA-like peptidoglycan-associated protein/tetratricopeptide (TPR) repeat protein
MRFSIAKLSIVFLILLLIDINTKTHAQNDDDLKILFTEAQKQYSDSNYTQAIEICNRILDINPELVGVQMLLSYVYDDIKNPELEIRHLNIAVKLNGHPYIKWRLGEAYYKMGNYSEALNFYNIYSRYKYITEKIRLTLACKKASCIFNLQSLKGFVENNEFTNANDVYWPSLSPDGKKLVFIQENESINEVIENSIISNLDNINNELSGGLEDSLFVGEELSEKEEIMFFTGYNREDGFGENDIYFSRYVDGKWNAPANAGNVINSEKSESQANYNSETKQLYFTSNRDGGAGEKDIWRADLMEFADDGLPVWSSPENLNALNTKGNEISPFFHSKTKQLYFSSDTRFGMGGFDLYEVSIDESGLVGEIVNLGFPINSKADELGLVVSYISDTAFFTSARTKDDDLEIFAFNLTRGLRSEPNFYVHLKVINQNSELPVQTSIEIVEGNNLSAENRNENVNSQGELLIRLKANQSYTFNISENGYMYYSKTVSPEKSNSISNPLEFNIRLAPIEVGSEVDLYNIYYETNSFAILPQSESGLQKLVSFLENNSNIKVEIQGHTDDTGVAENNLELSKQRAKSIVDYLVANKLELSRLRYAGYGDTLPIESNETESGRQLNRRTTVKIVDN